MASNASLFPLLKRAAPRLSRHFFTCRECVQKPTTLSKIPTSLPRPQFRSIGQTPFLKAFRSQSTVAPTSPLSKLRLKKGPIAQQVKASAGKIKRGYFPRVSRSFVAYWLFGSAASVFGIVILGGLTRLTESGLSITEWRPVTGTLPPMNEAAWAVEFAKYKASPEFQQLNPNMDLSEFKFIYGMEYAHRLWGRVIGLTFALPTLYFIVRRKVSGPIARNLVLINALIGLQGFVGWWMVKSGLKDDLFEKGSHPRVSQYRLATHLGIAFTVYTSMLWNGLSILRERRLVLGVQPNRAASLLSRLSGPDLAIFRRSTLLLALLVGTTALSGALVAGLDAGMIYNEFPYMGLGLTPPKSELFDSFYSRLPAPHPDLWWRNFLENPSLVQLDHRILATTSFVAVHALWAYSRFSPTVRAAMTQGSRRAMYGVLGLVWVQVILGISTLVYLVPTPVAATHQAGSLALLTGVIVLGSRVWTPSRLAKLVKGKVDMVKTLQARKAAKLARKQTPRLISNSPTVASSAQRLF